MYQYADFFLSPTLYIPHLKGVSPPHWSIFNLIQFNFLLLIKVCDSDSNKDGKYVADEQLFLYLVSDWHEYAD